MCSRIEFKNGFTPNSAKVIDIKYVCKFIDYVLAKFLKHIHNQYRLLLKMKFALPKPLY
jgi:hypothetical protein